MKRSPRADISAHLDTVRATYQRWFGGDYDLEALTCTLAVAAAERLDGDPVWLLLVGGSGAAKTETVMPLCGAGATVVSTISGEAALLSGTSRKERARDATGGLLRQMGTRGVLVIKDVTSILSMNRDTRALVLAALREVYDGSWSRHIGTDGGQTLSWRGRITVIGAVTTAWDAAHAVISAMGDRFLLVRLANGADDRRQASIRAMANVGHEQQMRQELSKVVGELIAAVDPSSAATLTDAERESLVRTADLVTRARTAVERDPNGDPAWAHALEMPTRFAKQLVQVVRGALALGAGREEAFAAARRCARDSIPPLRLRILSDLAVYPASIASHVHDRMQVSRRTVTRTLEELQLLGLVIRTGQAWSLAGPDVLAVVHELRRNVTTHVPADECAEMSPHAQRSLFDSEESA